MFNKSHLMRRLILFRFDPASAEQRELPDHELRAGRLHPHPPRQRRLGAGGPHLQRGLAQRRAQASHRHALAHRGQVTQHTANQNTASGHVTPVTSSYWPGRRGAGGPSSTGRGWGWSPGPGLPSSGGTSAATAVWTAGRYYLYNIYTVSTQYIYVYLRNIYSCLGTTTWGARWCGGTSGSPTSG